VQMRFADHEGELAWTSCNEHGRPGTLQYSIPYYRCICGLPFAGNAQRNR
jgi:hypothetical protein